MRLSTRPVSHGEPANVSRITPLFLVMLLILVAWNTLLTMNNSSSMMKRVHVVCTTSSDDHNVDSQRMLVQLQSQQQQQQPSQHHDTPGTISTKIQRQSHSEPIQRDHSEAAIKATGMQEAAIPPGMYAFPKNILQTVRDKNNISCQSIDFMMSWRRLNPGHRYMLFDARDRLAFMEKYHPKWVRKYNMLPSDVERSDLWRYLATYSLGGVYVDTDVICLKPIDTWNAEHHHDAAMLLALDPGVRGQFLQWILVSVANHSILGSMAHVIPYFNSSMDVSDFATTQRAGGGAWSKAVYRYLENHPAYDASLIHRRRTADIKIGDVRLMGQARFSWGWGLNCSSDLAEEPESYICHGYHGSWRKKDIGGHEKLVYNCKTPPELMVPLDI